MPSLSLSVENVHPVRAASAGTPLIAIRTIAVGPISSFSREEPGVPAVARSDCL